MIMEDNTDRGLKKLYRRFALLFTLGIFIIPTVSNAAVIEDKTGEVRVGNLVEVEVKLGELEIKSEPLGAKVILDGKEIGETPMVVSKVSLGKHLVRIVKEAYAPYEEHLE